MKLKYIDIIVFFIAAFYLSSCLALISGSELTKFLIFSSRLSLFIFSAILISKYNKRLFWIYIPIFMFYLFYGLLSGNRFSFIAADIFSAFVLINIFIFNNNNKDQFSLKIINTLSLVVFFGALSAIYYFSENSLQLAQSLADRIIVDESKEVSLKSAFSVIQLSIILLPFIWYVDSKRKFFIICSFFVYFGASAMILSRANIAGAALSLLFTVYIGYRERAIKLNYKVISITSIFILCGLIVFNKYNEEINLVSDLVYLRFQGIEGAGFQGAEIEVEEPRDIEAREYFNNIQPHQFIIGQGMGATNYYPFGRYSENGLMMMHRGENNLILKGGIIYLLLIYGSAIIAVIKLLKSNAYLKYSWMSVILIYLLLERGHNQYSQFLMLLFLSLAISYAFSITPSKKKKSLN